MAYLDRGTIYDTKQREAFIEKVTEEIKTEIDLAKICDDLAVNDQLPSPKLLKLKREEETAKKVGEYKKKVLYAIKHSKGKLPVDLWHRSETSYEDDRLLNVWLKPQGYILKVPFDDYSSYMRLTFYKPSVILRVLKYLVFGALSLGAIQLIRIAVGVLFG